MNLAIQNQIHLITKRIAVIVTDPRGYVECGYVHLFDTLFCYMVWVCMCMRVLEVSSEVCLFVKPVVV